MGKNELRELTINELESISHLMTAERQHLHEKALMVQEVLSEKIETQRIEKLLGKPQIISPVSIEDDEQTETQ